MIFNKRIMKEEVELDHQQSAACWLGVDNALMQGENKHGIDNMPVNATSLQRRCSAIVIQSNAVGGDEA